MATPLVDIATAVGDYLSKNAELTESAVLASGGGIHPDVDKKLIFHLYTALGRPLTPAEKKQARADLLDQLRAKQ